MISPPSARYSGILPLARAVFAIRLAETALLAHHMKPGDLATVQMITPTGGIHRWIAASLTSNGPSERVGQWALLDLKNIPTGIDVENGESVVTTGLDGVYPKGLSIGTVERIDRDPNTPFSEIVIKPTAHLNSLSHVIVLLTA